MSFLEPLPPGPEPEDAAQPAWIGPPENVAGLSAGLRPVPARTPDVAAIVTDLTPDPTASRSCSPCAGGRPQGDQPRVRAHLVGGEEEPEGRRAHMGPRLLAVAAPAAGPARARLRVDRADPRVENEAQSLLDAAAPAETLWDD
jgi:hypothetical protein